MIDTGDDAPDFTAPLATGDIESVTLSEELDSGPIVLAFFPGAFTSICTDEMCAFQDQLASFEDVGATVYGISRDTPFALNEFRSQNDLEFGLVSDLNREIIDDYGVSMDFTDMGVNGVAKRSVFIVDADGRITYRWIGDNPGVEPDYDAVAQAAAAAVEN
ncbi:redoxin domain-containing protein [Natranaeroarchaeum aerophilus]|uniref:Redoxin domain-containing protein n=1 Tax=Natranaeroarchaeum aerophilus TaxID=2917711 RepID=A0AAE3K6G9_9EURY|nr:redoxin domain-containing protein [Natranaeroarchaeum aerophilus]MCL9815217.1 redoxin domain-containing protein [Natranaeroarchaeum aerophilus]